jgi:hypothetical protein
MSCTVNEVTWDDIGGLKHERLEKFSIVAAHFHGCRKLEVPMLELGK